METKEVTYRKIVLTDEEKKDYDERLLAIVPLLPSCYGVLLENKGFEKNRIYNVRHRRLRDLEILQEMEHIAKQPQ